MKKGFRSEDDVGCRLIYERKKLYWDFTDVCRILRCSEFDVFRQSNGLEIYIDRHNVLFVNEIGLTTIEQFVKQESGVDLTGLITKNYSKEEMMCIREEMMCIRMNFFDTGYQRLKIANGWRDIVKIKIDEVSQKHQVGEKFIYKYSYTLLESRWRKHIFELFENEKKQLQAMGYPKSFANKYTMLDFIETNIELRKPYEEILEEMLRVPYA